MTSSPSTRNSASVRVILLLALLLGIVNEAVEWAEAARSTTHPKEVVNIQGEVRVPGEYELMQKKSLMRLIARAGGFTQCAYLKKIEIHRHDQTLIINGWKIIRGEVPDVELLANDLIVIRPIAPL